MSGAVPPMLWFLSWVGLSVGVLSFGFFIAIIIHRANMKALEVLRPSSPLWQAPAWPFGGACRRSSGALVFSTRPSPITK
jgi:hypothetical protein